MNRPDDTCSLSRMEATLASARAAHARAVLSRSFNDDLAMARDLRALAKLLRDLQGNAAAAADLCDTYLADRVQVTA